MQRDKNGFIDLGFSKLNLSKFSSPMALNSTNKEEKPKKEKKQKKPKRPFKKGSWKDFMYQRIIKHRDSKKVSGFHMTTKDTILIHQKDGKPICTITNGRVTENKLKKVTKKYPDAYVMINTGDSIYVRLPLNSYVKLCKLLHVSFEIVLIMKEDGDEDQCELIHDVLVVDNINELLHRVNSLRYMVYNIMELQHHFCYTDLVLDVRVVTHTEVDFKAYKDVNEFLQEYGILTL